MKPKSLKPEEQILVSGHKMQINTFTYIYLGLGSYLLLNVKKAILFI